MQRILPEVARGRASCPKPEAPRITRGAVSERVAAEPWPERSGTHRFALRPPRPTRAAWRAARFLVRLGQKLPVHRLGVHGVPPLDDSYMRSSKRTYNA